MRLLPLRTTVAVHLTLTAVAGLCAAAIAQNPVHQDAASNGSSLDGTRVERASEAARTGPPLPNVVPKGGTAPAPFSIRPIAAIFGREFVQITQDIGLVEPPAPGRTVVFSASGLPPAATFSPVTAQFSWLPGELDGDMSHTITVTAIDNGIPADVAAREMLDEIAAGTREIIVAEGGEKAMGELRRTPDALFDQVANMVANGYMEKLEAAE
jgi:hypothetical protein